MFFDREYYLIIKTIMSIELINGDCLIEMKKIPDKSIDLVVTSPPYNLGIEYENYKDSLSWKDYYSWCEKWLLELFRVCKEDGKICINHYFSMGNSIERTAPIPTLNSICEKIGFKHHSIAFWSDTTICKRSAWGSWLSASAPYISSPMEGILIMYKNIWKKQVKGESTISKEDFMEGCLGYWKFGTEKNDHPAPFPKRLPQLCIELLTYKNDLVLDPFMGSGTTGFVAKEKNRNFIGIEISPVYFDIAQKRIAQATQELFV